MDTEDLLGDSINLFGDKQVDDDNIVYGPLILTTAPKTILGNLGKNVERNRGHMSPACRTHCLGYEWGKDTSSLLELAAASRPDEPTGFDIVILSDLLHFDSSHDVLLSSLVSLLRKAPSSRTYIAAGKYTAAHVCAHFVSEAEKAGISLEEGEDDPVWRGVLDVHGGGLDREQLGTFVRVNTRTQYPRR
ncbi:hypothetical protein EIP86_009681 [Pleurotus ostreatoroseus]|nr:hypothetical protein EIP86_009681 [Pleurotus ostreatoroseus]